MLAPRKMRCRSSVTMKCPSVVEQVGSGPVGECVGAGKHRGDLMDLGKYEGCLPTPGDCGVEHAKSCGRPHEGARSVERNGEVFVLLDGGA